MSDKIEKNLSDLPPEVIELIGDYLKLTDVRALRSVNHYCYNVFSTGRYWKRYLHYSEKFFLCDLKSQSTVPGISEVVEEITEGRVNKWLGYLKLQNTHLNNWSCESLEVPFKISFPSSGTNSDLKNIVDNYNEHWLILCGHNNMIHAWNITAEPRALEPIRIDEYMGMTLLPQGKVLFQKKTCFELYSFDSTALILKFEHKLDINLNSGINNNYEFLVCDKLLIYFCPDKQSGECIVKIWDLHLGHKVGMIDLSKEELYQGFRTRFHIKSTSDLRIKFSEGHYPNILVVLGHENLACVTICNVEKMKLTHVIKTVVTEGVICEMKWNKICLYNNCRYTKLLSVYSFSGEKVKELVHVDVFDNVRFIIAKTKVIFKNKPHSIRIMDTSGGLVLQKYEFHVNPCVKPVGFIEPNLLVIRSWNCLLLLSISPEHTLIKNHICLVDTIGINGHVEIPTYPSKLIVHDDKEEAVFIYII